MTATTTMIDASPSAPPRDGFRLRPTLWFLLAWHGLFAGAYVTAFVSAEGSEWLHIQAGYIALALLVGRLLVALIVPGKGMLSLQAPPLAAWKAFLKAFQRNPAKAMSGRPPLVPASALIILLVAALALVTGLWADAWDWEDLHEGAANLSLVAVLAHVGLVVLAKFLSRQRDPKD